MKSSLVLKILFVLYVCYTPIFSQTYLTSSGGTVYNCSGEIYDGGGPSGDYANSEIMTFCAPAGYGQVEITITYVNLGSGDNLVIYNSDQSPVSNQLRLWGAGTWSGSETYTSTCGCLTIYLVEGGSPAVGQGFEASITGCNPAAVSNDNLLGATISPLDGSCLVGESNVGATADLSWGCFTSGNTVWYAVDPSSGMNTIDVYLDNATFANVEYILLDSYDCNSSSVTIVDDNCGTSATSFQWTDLTEDFYYLGVSSTTEGTFDLCITESYQDVCGDYYCGPGEDCSTCSFDCGACPEVAGGPYFHPTQGVQNTYVGMCMTNTCTGSYYDDGGPAGNYSNNIGTTSNAMGIYRTFCPDVPGNCVSATINSMDILVSGASCQDYLWVKDGPTQNSSTIWRGCGNTSIPDINTMNGTYGSGTYTSSHSSGCLTFVFFSGISGNAAGFDISLSCAPCAYGPDGSYNYDCSSAISICDDLNVSSEVWGPGLVSDGCGGCVVSENFTEWYYMEVATSGTMELELSPVGNSDVDFAIYQSSDCDALGPPVRCSYAVYNAPGKTGLSTSAADLSEDVTGDQWVAELNITAGEGYFILINEWNKLNPNSYTLDWTLSNGASFDCTILPIELIEFYGREIDKKVKLIWSTATEVNNEYFTILKSYNGVTYKEIGSIGGAGNSNSVQEYSFWDEEILEKTTYYQLKQTDFDGKVSYSDVIVVSPNEDIPINKLTIRYRGEDNIDISFLGNSNEEYSFEIYSITGQKVFSDKVTSDYSAWGHYQFNTSTIDNGIYSLVIRSNNSIISEKIVVQ